MLFHVSIFDMFERWIKLILFIGTEKNQLETTFRKETPFFYAAASAIVVVRCT